MADSGGGRGRDPAGKDRKIGWEPLGRTISAWKSLIYSLAFSEGAHLGLAAVSSARSSLIGPGAGTQGDCAAREEAGKRLSVATYNVLGGVWL